MKTMKQLMNAGLLTAGIMVISACGNNTENKGASESHADHENKSTNESATAGSVKIKDDKVHAVYQHYVHLTTALTNGDAAEAKVAANAIETGAKEIPGAKSVASSSSKIVAAGDIEDQRKTYSELSNDFITLVKKTGVSGGELYVDYCPMALNDKGAYWLSAKKEIRNPYFGEKMMTCGEVKETINN
jgi:hypothetical protein